MASKPQGLVLEAGKRAGIENLNSGSDIFADPKAIYDKEQEGIKKYIENMKYDNETKKDIVDICKDPSDEKSKQKIKEIANKLKEIYTEKLDIEKVNKIRNMESGIYRQKFTPSSKIFLFHFLYFMTVMAEIAILVIIGISEGGFNPVILVYGLLILLGSFLIGYGLGDIFYKSELGKLGQNEKSFGMHEHLSKIYIVLGLLLLLFVAFVRAAGSDSFIQVFLLTLFLGLVAAIFEGTAWRMHNLNNWAIQRQEEAMRLYASKLHAEDFSDEKYEGHILNLMKEICQNS
ncbi:hypothetical protein [Hydrogenobaculum acidophilum]